MNCFSLSEAARAALICSNRGFKPQLFTAQQSIFTILARTGTNKECEPMLHRKRNSLLKPDKEADFNEPVMLCRNASENF